MNERIKRLRKALGFTQQEFAERIGVKRNTIAQYEIGRNKPIDSIINLICREYNVSPEWLQTGEGEMFQPAPQNKLEALTQKYKLTAADKVLIEKYIKLNPDSRKTIIDFIKNVSAEIDSVADEDKNISLNDIYSEIPETPEELERQFPPVQMDEKKLG